ARPTREATFPSPTLSMNGERSYPDGESWRFGVGIADQADPQEWTARLGIEWYLDWTARPVSAAGAPLHWQTVRIGVDQMSPSPSRVQDLATATPGLIWVIGNEPDVPWQDGVTAARYARAYHELYVSIKEVDPSAQIAAGSISQVTPLRLAYLDQVLKAYEDDFSGPLPADMWTIHTYVLREERNSWGTGIPPGFNQSHGRLYEIEDHGRLDLLAQQLQDFRRWMVANGYRDLPLAVTEFGILMPPDYGFPPEFVAAYMRGAVDLFLTSRDDELGQPLDDHHLVQRWAWFSLQSSEFPTSNLVDLSNGTLTQLGALYRSLAVGGP
ncbi:MAG: hypothetical protein WBR18_11740, partial [Anaerolineales bacterium]